MHSGVLSDYFEDTLTPLLRLKPAFLLRDGIFSPYERTRRQQGQLQSVLSHRTAMRENFVSLHQLEAVSWQDSPDGNVLRPAALIAGIGKQIRADISLLGEEFSSAKEKNLQIEGNRDELFVHSGAIISPHAVFDTTQGPIVIDAEARVAAFCLVKGPVYIGARTQLDSCHIANSIVGTECRLGGEISDSVIGSFTNKHHEGFVGHSLIGDWVNLGALTTTSDLKNNYGEVRLTFAGDKYSSGTIKFGCVIGDYAKTAIGTMLGTGSIVDLGANLFGLSHRSGYFRPFLWGETKIYDRNKFIEDAGRMMQRRGQSVTPALEKMLRGI